MNKTINERLGIIENKLSNIEIDVNYISKSLVGNGNVGLKTQVEISEEKIENLNKIITNSQGNLKWFVIVTLSVLTTITVIINYIV